MPLRNTKQTLALAGLEGNKGLKELNHIGTKTFPVYNVPDHLMEGVECKEFLLSDKENEDQIAKVVEEATKELLGRTGGAGFALLCNNIIDSRLNAAERGVERAGATALVYHKSSSNICSDVEVEDWLRRRRSGEEERVLIADHEVSRGWECSHILVIDMGRVGGLENLVMRTVGYCALVNEAPYDEPYDESYDDSDTDSFSDSDSV